ncbi:MAG: hypothetical protein QOF33_304 [Thermomicrobiales bacterium]|nr:hypothetical protein [Thermomicrobiales bacterium]
MIGDESPGEPEVAASDVPQYESGPTSHSRPKGGNQSRRGSRPPEGADDRRRRKPSGGERRATAGYEDGIERAFCLSLRHLPPPAFPVQHRTGVAALTPVVVARRLDSALLCDCEHDGPHSWPDGEIARDRDA